MCLSRCCCCIPLRRGLLTWGYSKLMLYIFAIGAILLVDITQDTHMPPAEYAISVVFILLGVIDVVFTILFILAGHRKNKTLFKVYNGYNITFLLLTASVMIGWIVAKILVTPSNRPKITIDVIIECVLTVLHILWTVYIILLVRSEIKKLERQRRPNIQFINPGRPYYNAY